MNYELKSLGLTDNEISIYLMILKSGSVSATQIRKATNVANSRVYSALDSLIEKGIINYEKRNTGKLYTAVDPEILTSIMKSRLSKLESQVPVLKKLQAKENTHTETSVFEGYNGFKLALKKLVQECPKGETIDIIGFSNQAYKNEKLAALLRDVNKESKKKNHKFRMILDNKKNTFVKQRTREKWGELKFMGKGFVSPAAIDIFCDYVFILMWDETPYAFIIKNQNIADGFRVYFEFLWNMAKK